MDIVRFKLQVSNPFVVIWASKFEPIQTSKWRNLAAGELFWKIRDPGTHRSVLQAAVCLAVIVLCSEKSDSLLGILPLLPEEVPKRDDHPCDDCSWRLARDFPCVTMEVKWSSKDGCWLWSLREHPLLYKYRRISDTSTSCQQNASREFAALSVEQLGKSCMTGRLDLARSRWYTQDYTSY